MARSFDGLYGTNVEYYGRASDGLMECVEVYVPTRGRALDVGCGQGRNALWLAAQGFSVVGIDSSFPGIKALRKDAMALDLPLRCLVGDIVTFDLGTSAYSLVVVSTLLNHLEPAVIKVSCEKLQRCLAAGGVLYCVSFTTADPGYSGKGGPDADFVRHYFRPGELRESFSGLEILLYQEYQKLDETHGPPHIHGKAKLIARRAP